LVDRSDVSLVGTPDYVAPEIVLSRQHSFSADYWSLGAMLYEFVVGVPPFHAATEAETHRRAVIGHLRWPDGCSVSPQFRDLVGRLLAANPAARLGHTRIGEIADHPWFADAPTEPPFIPQLSDRRDTAYFAQRYEFDDAEDAALLADLQGCAQPGRGNCVGMESFGSVDFAELAEANRMAAEEFDLVHPTRARRMSSPPQTVADAPTMRRRSLAVPAGNGASVLE
jgi:serine/threonine protein kinase